MGQKLWTLSEDDEHFRDGQREYFFHCPGCKHGHRYTTAWSPKKKADYEAKHCGPNEKAPTWTFNGNLQSPSFQPSLLYRYTKTKNDEVQKVCHLYVTNGQMQFLSDCTHEFAGKTVDMGDID